MEQEMGPELVPEGKVDTKGRRRRDIVAWQDPG